MEASDIKNPVDLQEDTKNLRQIYGNIRLAILT
jgi:hypothetical protein